LLIFEENEDAYYQGELMILCPL